MKILQTRAGQWLIFWVLSFIWGSSFILMKKGLIAFPPDVMASLRIGFTFLFFLPIAIRNLDKISKSNLKSLLIVGYIGNFFPAILFGIAETHISSALAGMINATTPFFTWLAGMLLYRSRANLKAIAGLVIGFIGTLGLVTDNPLRFFDSWNLYAILVLVATLFYGINTNELKYKLKDLDALAIVSLAFLFAGPTAIFWLIVRGFPVKYISSPAFYKSFFAIMTLAFFSSFVALILFNYFVKYTNTLFASSITYAIPIFAIIWGLLDGERILWWQYLFMLLVIAGVYIINQGKTYKIEANE